MSSVLSEWRQDARLAVRGILRRPGTASVIVAVMGLGLGAVICGFALVDTFLLRPLPFAEGDRLVWLQSRHGSTDLGVSHGDFLDWKQAPIFESLALFNAQHHAVVGLDQGAESLPVTRTTSSLFAVLRVRPHLGRLLTNQDDPEGAPQTVLLSFALWQRRFGQDPEILGSTLRIDGAPYSIVGVLPAGFDFPARSELWLSRGPWADQWPYREIRVDSALGRLAPEVSVQQAREVLTSLSKTLEDRYPETNRGIRASLQPLRDVWSRQGRTGLLFLLGACFLLLALAAANVLHLMLVWTGSRYQELVIRRALGGSPRRLMRLPVLESLVLGLLGGGLGLVLAVGGLSLAEALLPARFPSWLRLELSAGTLALALGLSCAMGLLSGLVPVLQALRANTSSLLGAGARTLPSGPITRRLRQTLVVVEIALALVLLVGAGLLTASFAQLQKTETGFDPAVLTFQLDLPVQNLESFEQVRAYYREILERVATAPGVSAAGATTSMPMARPGTWDKWEFTLEDREPETQRDKPRAYGQGVSDDYFRAMGIPLVEGRGFSSEDNAAGTPGAIVSRRFAQRFWPGGSALGKRLKMGGADSQSPFTTIVGVVEDVPFEAVDGGTGIGLYLPLNRMVSWPLYVALQAQGDRRNLESTVRDQVAGVSTDLGVRDFKLLGEHLSGTLWRQRLWASLAGILSILALVLSGAGVFSVASFLVFHRSRELAIRTALGAAPTDLMRSLALESLRLALLGIGLGLIGAILAGRILSGLLFEVRAQDPRILVSAALGLTIIALCANLLPLRRASRAEPAGLLRNS